jgi:hypothetical protein
VPFDHEGVRQRQRHLATRRVRQPRRPCGRPRAPCRC